MPTKPRHAQVTRADLARLKAEVKRLADRVETNSELIRASQLAQELHLQRTAQLQAEHDAIKVAWGKLPRT